LIKITEYSHSVQPTASTFQINIFDISIKEPFSAHSAVCRDSTGAIIQCFAQISPPCSAIYVEASAALLAAQLSLSLKLPFVIFEGDSLIVTLAINNFFIMQDWKISSIILYFLSTIPSTTSRSTSHINQSANFYAHHVPIL
jgi:hypothetical protein